MNLRTKIFTKALAVAILSVSAFTFSQLLNIKDVKAATLENVNTRSIEVTGTGSIKAVPDIAILNVGVMTNGVSPTAVQDENTKTMNRVLASIKALGVDEKDIKTDNYYMNPEYDQSNTKGGSKVIGYTLNNVMQVKVRDMKKAGEVLSAAVNAGANINNGISFSLSNVDDYYNQALSKAMSNAKSKADILAKALGVSIGLPSKVVENSNYYSPSPVSNYNSGKSMAVLADSATVSQGEIEVTASVTVSYGY